MVKVDNGTADFDQTDIDLIVELLQQDLEEIENHVYWKERNYERRDHIKDLINEFSKL